MLSERGLVIVTGDINLDPVIAALPKATSPELSAHHLLNALLLTDLTEHRAVLGASGVQLLLLSSDAVLETIKRNNSRWDELLGNLGGIQSFALTASGFPARLYSYPKQWSTRQLTHWNQTSSNEYVMFGSRSAAVRLQPSNPLNLQTSSRLHNNRRGI